MIAFMQSKARIAHHACAALGRVTCGIARVQALELRDDEAARASQLQCTVHWCCATGLLVIQAGVEREDFCAGGGIDLLGSVVSVKVREICADDENRPLRSPTGAA